MAISKLIIISSINFLRENIFSKSIDTVSYKEYELIKIKYENQIFKINNLKNNISLLMEEITNLKNKIRTSNNTFNFNYSPHDILGLTKNSTDFEIRNKFKLIIKSFHPDKMNSELNTVSNTIFKILNDAKDYMLKKNN